MRISFSFVILVCYSNLVAQCLMGLKTDETDYYNTPILVEIKAENLPSSASLKNYCPKPGNQLNNLTSAGWATTFYAATILHAKQSGEMDVETITSKAFSPTYTQLAVQGDEVDCGIPISIKESLEVLEHQGAPQFTDFPYFCPEEGKITTQQPVISGYRRLFNAYDSDESKIRKIKTTIHQGLPVIVALQTNSSFCSPSNVWTPSKSEAGASRQHAICVIGYDDFRYGGSLELLNSWGKSWGQNGYIHSPYSNVMNRITEAYIPFLQPIDQEFELKVEVSSNYGSPMPVSVSKAGYEFIKGYGNGHQFHFNIATNFSGYMYLYYYNARGEKGLLFPRDDISGGILPFDSTFITIPGNNRYIQLDDQPGTETMVIVLSMDSILEDEIYKVITNEINPSLKFDPNQLKINGKIDPTNRAAVIPIALNHI
ncbi:MAG: DUF4384 domain-containing protein [Cyclobacteriaceae bacterium]|nr:DUF4384 domain-containing protein [Cyclobacteriaceae bacterium SS2]